MKCPILSNFGFSRRIVIKVPDVKFDENMYSESRAVHADRQTDKVKPIGASHECANALQVRRAAVFHAVSCRIILTKKKCRDTKLLSASENLGRHFT